LADIIRVSLRDHQIPRESTHLELREFLVAAVKGAGRTRRNQTSFLLGYLVHLVTDKLWYYLVNPDSLGLSRGMESQNPRFTLLVDQALWLRTAPETRSSLVNLIAEGSDRGVMSEILASRAAASRGSLDMSSAIADWKGRLARAVLHGPANLGLSVENADVISNLAPDSPGLEKATSMMGSFQRLLFDRLSRACTCFRLMAEVDDQCQNLPPRVMQYLREDDATPSGLTCEDRRAVVGTVDELMRL
jgi:hypothetical protein